MKRKLFNFSRAFTLVELLIVIAIMALMMSLAVPAFNSLRGGNDFTSELYDISGTLERARAYAMSANSYVLVGIIEVSSTLSTSGTGQRAVAAGTVGGRVTMAVIASKSGTRPYQTDLNNRNFSLWGTEYGTGSATANGGGFIAISKLMQFQGLHLVDLQGANTPPTSGNMMRPAVDPAYDIPNTACAPENAFTWPLGQPLTGGQYQFGSPKGNVNPVSNVIEFDPQGSARIIGPSYWEAIPHYIEIGLQPVHGSAAASAGNQTSGQLAAIQVDGMTGAVRIYRP